MFISGVFCCVMVTPIAIHLHAMAPVAKLKVENLRTGWMPGQSQLTDDT